MKTNIAMSKVQIFLLTLVLCLTISCNKDKSEKEKEPVAPPEVEDVVLNLLVMGAPEDMPAETRAINSGDDKVFGDLTALIFEWKDNQYKYSTVRPMFKNEGVNDSYKVSLPANLVGKNVKVGVCANSLAIFKDDILKRLTVGMTEAQVTQNLVLSRNTRWNTTSGTNYDKIPMYGTTEIKPLANNTSSLPPVSLVKMLARVDVGMNYDGNIEESTARKLANFNIMAVRVYYSKAKGCLAFNSQTVPTMPASPHVVTNIPPYGISVPGGENSTAAAVEREIYMCEYDGVNDNIFSNDTVRPCILVQGSYLYDDDNNPVTPLKGVNGWYRLDFHDGTEYIDIVRNHIYRFNIKEVRGIGSPNEVEALKSVSANVLVTLESYTMGQSDFVFDGQHFLSVSNDSLTLYKENLGDFMNIETNHPDGWKIEITKGIASRPIDNMACFSPNSGASGLTKDVMFKYYTNIQNGGPWKMEFNIVAGNLKKSCVGVIYSVNAPDPLEQLNVPAVLYFRKQGGTQPLVVTTNLAKAEFQLFPSLLLSASLGTKQPKSVPVIVAPAITQPTAENEGKVSSVIGVSLSSGSTNIATKTQVIQFLRDLTGTVTTTPIEWNATSFNTKTSTLDGYSYVHKHVSVPPASTFEPLIYQYVSGLSGSGQQASGITQNNTSYSPREIAKVYTYPASKTIATGVFPIVGTQLEPLIISIPGHQTNEVAVMQNGKPKPNFKPTTNLNWPWNITANQNIPFVKQSGSGDGNEVSSYNMQFGGATEMISNYTTGSTITSPSSPVVVTPTMNRTGSARTLQVTSSWLVGFNEQVSKYANPITITQTAPPVSNTDLLAVTVETPAGAVTKEYSVHTGITMLRYDIPILPEAQSLKVKVSNIANSGILNPKLILSDPIIGLGSNWQELGITSALTTVPAAALNAETVQATSFEFTFQAKANPGAGQRNAVYRVDLNAYNTATTPTQHRILGFNFIQSGAATIALAVEQMLNSGVFTNNATKINDVIPASGHLGHRIKVTSNTSWTASTSNSFVTLSATSGNAGETIITAQAKENPNGNTSVYRDADIIVKLGNGTQKTVKLRQDAGAPINYINRVFTTANGVNSYISNKAQENVGGTGAAADKWNSAVLKCQNGDLQGTLISKTHAQLLIDDAKSFKAPNGSVKGNYDLTISPYIQYWTIDTKSGTDKFAIQIDGVSAPFGISMGAANSLQSSNSNIRVRCIRTRSGATPPLP